jgi:tetratricopeptide (TPR) repeat protein
LSWYADLSRPRQEQSYLRKELEPSLLFITDGIFLGVLMGESRDQESFCTTLPGILTRISGVLIAITGLIGVLVTAGIIGDSPPIPTPVPPTATPASALPTTTPNPTLASDFYDRGVTSYGQRQYQEALDYFQRVLDIYQAGGPRREEALTLTYIGGIHHYYQQYNEALENFQQALVIYQAGGPREKEGITLYNIGLVYGERGQYNQALENYQQALVIYREVGDRAWQAAILNNIGETYHALGQ